MRRQGGWGRTGYFCLSIVDWKYNVTMCIVTMQPPVFFDGWSHTDNSFPQSFVDFSVNILIYRLFCRQKLLTLLKLKKEMSMVLTWICSLLIFWYVMSLECALLYSDILFLGRIKISKIHHRWYQFFFRNSRCQFASEVLGTLSFCCLFIHQWGFLKPILYAFLSCSVQF